MSQNINQIFIVNPITSNASTDLMYFGQSPYGGGNDAAMTYANFSAQFGTPYTASALTSVNDTNVTLNLGGSPSTALLHATSLTLGWSGQLSLTRGGSNASLTASNGGVVYSTASAMAILAGTSTANQVLVSGANSAPSWSSMTLNPWVDQTTSSVTMIPNTGYTSDAGATLVTFALPTTSSIGDWIEINGKGSGGWIITQNGFQQIHIGNGATSFGATGSISSVNQYDCIRLRCTTASAIWVTVSQQSSGFSVI